MKIAIMGTGGVGGYFGAQLAAAGEDVTFIARGAHLQAIREHGLKVESGTGPQHIQPATASDDPAAVGPVDVVLFAPKLWDTEATGAASKPLLGPGTALISLQNGIDSEDRLLPILGADHVVGGIAYIGAAIAEPGVIRHVAIPPAIDFGELDGSRSARLERFLGLCEKAGIKARLVTDVQRAKWLKFALLASFAAVTALTRRPAGVIREDPDTRRLLTDAIAEVAAVAKAKGYDLGEGIVDQTMTVVDGMAPQGQASMATDLQRGNRLELEWLSGVVYRLGQELGVPTPVHRVTYAALKPWANGAPQDGC